MTSTDDLHDDVTSVINTYLQERFPALRDLGPNTQLLRAGAVDSLGVLDLMMFLEERFSIDLADDDFAPENIETPERLATFVRNRRQS